MTAKFTQSSGNIFADLGFSADESLAYRLRSELMIELKRQILERKLNQRQAAIWLGVTQPRISDLLRGQFEKFSVDGLIAMLGKAGLHVTLRVEEALNCQPIAQEFDVELPAEFPTEIVENWSGQMETLSSRMPIAAAAADYAQAA